VSKPLSPPPAAYAPRPTSVDAVLELVRARGGRATSSRRALLEVLFERDEHLTAEDLVAAVQARSPDVHLSTVYRNLDELQRMGVIAHSHLGHGPATYQLAPAAHAHLVCGECGAMVEAPDDLFEQLASSLRDKLGFRIDPHHFAMLGWCRSCETRTDEA